MLKHSLAAATLAALVASTVPASAAEGPTPVKVALLDLSATMGMGPAGQGMMGSGGGMGSGGWQGRMGTMGPGMMGMTGPGMWQGGQGMMSGPGGMMGMMSIRIDHSTVRAGAVTFDVTNWSRATLHELLVVAVDVADAQLPYDYSEATVAEDQVKVLGETKELSPNASEQITVSLTPGNYLLICNIPGHYAAGMATPLNVTP